MSDVRATVPRGPVSPVFMSPLAYPQAKLQVAVAAAKTWRIFRQRPWRFAFLAFLPLVATLLVAFVPAAVRTSAGDGVKIVDQILVAVVQYGVQFICQNASVYGAARLADGLTFGVGEAMGVGARRLLPFVGIALLTLIVVFVGFILFVIPGLIVAVYLCLAAPACVIETRGPIASLDRSVRLVRGNWWRVVGVALFGGFLPFLGACAVIGLVAAALSPLHAAQWTLLLLAPLYLVLVAIGAIMIAVLFLDLRAAKEGRAPGAVAGVFD